MRGAGVKRDKSLLFVLGIALFLVLFRYFSGLNYAAVHVVLPAETPSHAKPEIYGWGGAGTSAQRFDWTPELPGIRLLLAPTGRIQELYLIALVGSASQYERSEVLYGDNWIGPAQKRFLVSKPVKYRGVISGIPELPVGYELLRLTPQVLSKSAFISEPGVNWQGDLWLLLVPLLQALFLRLLAGHGLRCLRALPTRFSASCGIQLTPMLRPAGRVLQLIVLLLVAHQLLVVLHRFLSIRSGMQASLAVSVISLLVVLLGQFFRRLQVSSVRQLWFHGCFLLLLFGSARVLWSLGIDSYQATDYGRYARYGEWIAAGRWNDILSIREPLAAVYARRAFVTTVPAALIFGPGTRGIEIVNLITQLAMVAVFWCYCSRVFGLLAATAALPYVMLFPGFWYLGTIASHNVPTHFLLVLLFLCGGSLEKAWRSVEEGRGSPGRLLMLSVAYGVVSGLLELSRTYGIFVMVGGLLTVACVLLRRVLVLRKQMWRDWYLVLVRPACVLLSASLVSLVVHLQLVQAVDGYIAARLGETQTIGSMVETLAAIDSTKDAGGRAVDSWRRVYSVSVPPNYRNELSLRKLLHEKLVMGRYVYSSVFQRNDVYSRQIDGMLQTFDRLKGLTRRLKSSRVPWFSFQQGVCDGVYLLMLLPALLRLLPLSGQVLHIGEVQPLLLIFLVGCAIFLLTESHPYYGFVFALPLCWNAGLVTIGATGWCQGGGESRLLGMINVSVRSVLLLGLLVAMHLLTGALLDGSNRCFCGIAYRETAATKAEKLLRELSRVHFAVARNAALATESDVLKASVEIGLPASSGNELCFLLTTNQRILNEDPALGPDRLIVDFGLSRTPYAISVNGRMWRSGFLSELKAPEFCVVSLEDFPAIESGKVIVEVALGDAPTLTVPGGRPEWLAIEYPHVP